MAKQEPEQGESAQRVAERRVARINHLSRDESTVCQNSQWQRGPASECRALPSGDCTLAAFGGGQCVNSGSKVISSMALAVDPM